MTRRAVVANCASLWYPPATPPPPLLLCAGELVAERDAGPHLQGTLREEDSGETAGGRGAESVEEPAVVVGGRRLHPGEQDRHSGAPLQAAAGTPNVASMSKGVKPDL